MRDIIVQLLNDADEKYKNFHQKLIPTNTYPIIGVRVPIINKIAKNILKEKDVVLNFFNTKHTYYEEYFLHGILIGLSKFDLNTTLKLLDDFLPYINNWAICDSLVSSLKIFKKYREEIFPRVKKWLNSKHEYTVRFAIVVLLNYFLDDCFISQVLNLIKSINHESYYVNMATAWLISVALVKQYEKTLPLLEEKSLPNFIQNKAIQKAIESFRISDFNKSYLKTLKIY